MEKFKIFRSDRLGRLAAMLVCFLVIFHAKAKRFDNLLKCDILLKLKELRGILKESQKKSYKSENKLI